MHGVLLGAPCAVYTDGLTSLAPHSHARRAHTDGVSLQLGGLSLRHPDSGRTVSTEVRGKGLFDGPFIWMELEDEADGWVCWQGTPLLFV